MIEATAAAISEIRVVFIEKPMINDWRLVAPGQANQEKSGSLYCCSLSQFMAFPRASPIEIEQRRLHAVICKYPKPISSKILEMSRIGIYIPVASIVALSFGEFSECPKFRITKNKRQYTLSYVRPPSHRFS